MGYMFSGCSSLTSLDVSNFNTSNVTNMGDMFRGCSSLTSLNVSSFDTSNVTRMYNMFSGCSSLTSLDLSSFDLLKVTSYSSFLYNCTKLTEIISPQRNTIADIALPSGTWKGNDGKTYTKLPTTTGTSITLIKTA